MTYRPRRRCRICGADRLEGVHISRSGLCPECGHARLDAALRQQQAKAGPFYLAWLEGITAGISRLWGDRLPPDLTSGSAPIELPQPTPRGGHHAQQS